MEDSAYKTYLQERKDIVQRVTLTSQLKFMAHQFQKSTCSGHDAINMADTKCSRGLAVTRVGACE